MDDKKTGGGQYEADLYSLAARLDAWAKWKFVPVIVCTVGFVKRASCEGSWSVDLFVFHIPAELVLPSVNIIRIPNISQ